MSIRERIEARTALVGGDLPIRRALPSRGRRTIGAWCFLDHAGPADYAPGAGMHVGPHPHIGLQTFTWMIEGEVLHRDSLGCEQWIRPGQVNLMTAGRGIAHSEDSGDGGRIHLAQLWIALPDHERHREPSFHHYPQLPMLDAGGFRATVLAGSACGHTAPAQVFTPLVGVDLTSRAAARTQLPLETRFEHGALVLRGEVEVAGERLQPGTLLYLPPGAALLDLRCDAAAQLLLIGGEPFGEELLLWWNFVGRTPDEISAATADWNAGRRFGEVRNATTPRIAAPDVAGLHLRPGH